MLRLPATTPATMRGRQRAGTGAGAGTALCLVLLLALAPLPTPAFRLPSLPSLARGRAPGVPTPLWPGITTTTMPVPPGSSRGSRGSSAVAPRLLSPVPPEALMAPPPEKVLAAVERAGGRVTVQDVAALAGVDLGTAQKGLVRLAALVDGDLEVGRDGDLVYQFPRNFRTALRTRSVAQRAKEVWAKVWPSLFYLTRVSFGLCLVLSIVLVFATITFAGSASMSTGDDRDDRRRGDGGGAMFRGPSFYFGPSPFDFFYYRPYGYYYTHRRGTLPGADARGDDGPEQMGFLESCFSYIFGDGDPNADIEEERYRLIAAVIRRSGGAVVAEQLAPYLDVPAPKDPTAYAVAGSSPLTAVVDESFVLPALTRLNGRPEVTPDGNIVYVFPDLMTSAVEGGLSGGSGLGGSRTLDAKWARQEAVDAEMLQYQALSAFKLRELLQRNRIPTEDCYDKPSLLERLKLFLLAAPSTAKAQGDAPYLEEQPIPFSVAPATNRVFAGILGGINLLGAFALGGVLRDYATVYGAATQLPGLLGLSQALYVPLLIYAVGFNVIPLLRSFWVKEKNAEIGRRNEARRAWAGVLGRAIGPLYDKILAARNYRSSLKVVRRADVAYSTAQPAAEQAGRKEGQDLDAFDRRLSRSQSSSSSSGSGPGGEGGVGGGSWK